MKLSIVVPVYNVEEYLEECIESILHQTYQDFEIILVDDGSTDGSGQICDRYALRYPDTVKVIHNENQGQLMTRSSGIEAATGDVLLLIDSDDYIREDALDLLRKRFAETECDMILYNASVMKDFSTDFCEFGFEDGELFGEAEKNKLYKMLITTSKLNPLWLKAVKKEIAAAIPEYYKYYGLRNAGDLLYSIPMLSSAQKISYLAQNLYYYRLRVGSIVHTYNPARHKSIKRVHQELEKYINIWGMQEMHPQHYAREVRGWIVCLKQLMIYRGKKTDIHPAQLMQELAEDDYFRNAYQKMAAGELSKRDALLSKWLYERKYRWLMLIGGIVRMMEKLRNCLKTK